MFFQPVYLVAFTEFLLDLLVLFASVYRWMLFAFCCLHAEAARRRWNWSQIAWSCSLRRKWSGWGRKKLNYCKTYRHNYIRTSKFWDSEMAPMACMYVYMVYPCMVAFYAWKLLLLSACLSHRNSVCPSVCLSVCHTGGSVKNDAS